MSYARAHAHMALPYGRPHSTYAFPVWAPSFDICIFRMGALIRLSCVPTLRAYLEGWQCIWFGLVWVWFGFGLVLVWFGVVLLWFWFCFVLVWFGLVWFGLVWFGLVWFGFGLVWFWFGLVWFGLVWFWFGLVWFGVCVAWPSAYAYEFPVWAAQTYAFPVWAATVRHVNRHASRGRVHARVAFSNGCVVLAISYANCGLYWRLLMRTGGARYMLQKGRQPQVRAIRICISHMRHVTAEGEESGEEGEGGVVGIGCRGGGGGGRGRGRRGRWRRRR